MSKEIYSHTTARLIAVYNSLKNPSTVKELAELFKVNERTIQRDIRELKEAGLIEKNGTAYCLKEKHSLTGIRFTTSEMAAFEVANKLTDELTEAPFAKEYSKAMLKIKSEFERTKQEDKKDKDYFKALDYIRVYKNIPKDKEAQNEQELRNQEQDFFTQLNKAIYEKYYIKLTYFAWHKKQEQTYEKLEPVTFAYYLDNWYLIAHNPQIDDRVFCRFEGIQQIELLAEKFERKQPVSFIKKCFEELEYLFVHDNFSMYIAQWLFYVGKRLPKLPIKEELLQIATKYAN